MTGRPVLWVPSVMMDAVPLDLFVTAPLIGRADDLERLCALVRIGSAEAADPSSPRGGMVLLSGDAGIGKTRLLTAFCTRAVAAGSRVSVGHCLDFGDSALPYLPFNELFGRLDAETPRLVEAAVEAHPPLRRVVPGRRPPTDAGPVHQVDRGEVFEAVHAALERFGAAQPVLLVIEDVHWADQSTRDLLSFLFTRGFTTAVSLVVSYRSDDLHRRHPLRPTLAQWTRVAGLGRVDLGPLDDVDVRRLVRVLRSAALRESDVHAVVERAEGNAFFTEELVAAAGDGTVPADLASLLLVRLDQLDDTARQVVRVASVAGRGITHEVLAEVAGLDDSTLERGVRAAVERHVLVPAGSDSYAFRHALLGEAVYDDLLPGERVRLHAAYVRVLSGRDTVGAAADLARHARAAHDLDTALAASVRAGDEASAVGGPAEALRHYELALELSADTTADAASVDVDELTVRASAAATAAGHVHKAVALVEQAIARLPAGVAPADRGRLLLALGTAAIISDSHVDVLAATTEALTLVPADPPTALRCRIMNLHAEALGDLQRDEDATRWADDALALAERLGLADVLAAATTTLARLQERRGDPEASRRVLERVIAEARAGGDPAELRGLHNLGGLHLEQGRLPEALGIYRRGSERAAQLGRQWAPYGLDARVLAGVVAYQSGEWDDALAIIDVSGQSPPGQAEALLAAVGLMVAAGRGDDTAFGLLPQVRPWWEHDGMIGIVAAGAAIDLHGDVGNLTAATAAHDDVVACVGGLWRLPDFQARVRLSGLLLGQLAAEASRSAAAERTRLAARGDELVGAAARAAAGRGSRSRGMGPEGLAWIARVRAEHLRLRWLTGVDPPSGAELVGAWEESVAAFEAYPHTHEHARSQTRLAGVLRTLGDPARAREVADAARATAQRLGARPLQAELRALGTLASGRRDEGGRTDAALTGREREVLVLVAQGRSNREIGGQLFISAKTVSVHVSNILAKLSAGGRTEAVAVARRRGLLTDGEE